MKKVILYKLDNKTKNNLIFNISSYTIDVCKDKINRETKNCLIITDFQNYKEISFLNKDNLLIVLNCIDYININCFSLPFSNTIEKTISSNVIYPIYKCFNKNKLKLSPKTIAEKTKNLLAILNEKDASTSLHSTNVADFALMIANNMGLCHKQKEAIYYAALLHDIGKIAIPDEVLLKPGRLDKFEFEVIKKHPEISDMLLSDPDFSNIKTIVKYHHEWYNGKGYPDGISGETIPIEARILNLADSFEAMTSNRLYKKAKTVLESLDEIKKCQGSQFDPFIAEAFLASINQPKKIKIYTN